MIFGKITHFFSFVKKTNCILNHPCKDIRYNKNELPEAEKLLRSNLHPLIFS